MKVLKTKTRIVNLEEVSYATISGSEDCQCIKFSMKNGECLYTENSSAEEIRKIFDIIYTEMTTGE